MRADDRLLASISITRKNIFLGGVYPDVVVIVICTFPADL